MTVHAPGEAQSRHKGVPIKPEFIRLAEHVAQQSPHREMRPILEEITDAGAPAILTQNRAVPHVPLRERGIVQPQRRLPRGNFPNDIPHIRRTVDIVLREGRSWRQKSDNCGLMRGFTKRW